MFLLQNIELLGPILGAVARYLMEAVPNYVGDKHELGRLLVESFQQTVIKKSTYMQMIILDLLAQLPELDHIDLITAMYPHVNPSLTREILLVAGNADRSDWLRDRKASFSSLNTANRRAFIYAARSLPNIEGVAWLKSVSGTFDALEKITGGLAFPGELNLTQLRIEG